MRTKFIVVSVLIAALAGCANAITGISGRIKQERDSREAEAELNRTALEVLASAEVEELKRIKAAEAECIETAEAEAEAGCIEEAEAKRAVLSEQAAEAKARYAPH
jgi:Flp pilus assembly protein CpaB